MVYGGECTARPCHTDVIDLDDPNKKCDGVPDYPVKADAPTGAIVDGTFVSCGGRPDYSGEVLSTCYKFGSSTELATLAKGRFAASSIAIHKKLWVTGGATDGGKKRFADSEVVDSSNGWSVSPGPNLPNAMSYHCLTRSHGSTIFLINEFKSWHYNFENQNIGNMKTVNWNDGPALKFKKISCVCGTIKDSSDDSKTIVVATGGWKRKETELLDTSDVSGETWLEGPDLSAKIAYGVGTTTIDSKTFLIVGGVDSTTEKKVNTIYRLQCHNMKCQWTTKDQTFQEKRQRFLAFIISSKQLDCK